MTGSQNQRMLSHAVIDGPLVPANPNTDGSRPGWLTPQVQDSKHSGANLTENGDRDLLVNQVNWPTPMQQDARSGPNNVGGNAHRVARGSVALADAVLFPKQVNWATPKASDPQHSGPNMRDSAGNYALPAQAVREQWATPRAGCPGSRAPGTGGKVLEEQVKTWATPQSRDAKGAEGRMIREGHCSDLPSQTEVAPTGQWNRSNGKLNPRWVSVLMNLPVFWTRP